MFLQVDVTDSRLYTTDMRSFEAALFVRRLYTHTKKTVPVEFLRDFFFWWWRRMSLSPCKKFNVYRYDSEKSFHAFQSKVHWNRAMVAWPTFCCYTVAMGVLVSQWSLWRIYPSIFLDTSIMREKQRAQANSVICFDLWYLNSEKIRFVYIRLQPSLPTCLLVRAPEEGGRPINSTSSLQSR